ncbi:nitrile hydratase accessory protein [Aestuariivirga sp.]|uniref:nitrile hydratase accessory protein n=1 Tax=Aestuariivirga sp. TaxID=2650926 RepID=UPI0039E25125
MPPDEHPFAEPWEAQAFAMAVKLQEQGLFTPVEWAEALGAALRQDTKRSYYESWLSALETLVTQKGAMTRAERLNRIDAWDKAARATPHGQPIELSRSGPAPETAPAANRKGPASFP